MIPTAIVNFFAEHQDLLWLLVIAADLSCTLLFYRLFGKTGLYAIVAANVMLSNLQGPKLTIIFGMETSMGMILYAGIYFATDLLSEKYGKREANRAVVLGFMASVLMTVMVAFSLMFLPSNDPDSAVFAASIHEAMKILFGFTPLFVFGSLMAYLLSQSLDVWVFHYIKQKTNGRHLWLRNNVSTIVSQLVDTLIYGFIVWAPIVGVEKALKLAMAKYILKVVIAMLDTPFIYWACAWDMRSKDWSDSAQSHHKACTYNNAVNYSQPYSFEKPLLKDKNGTDNRESSCNCVHEE